jgi:CSLREA domain-containing protein
MATSGVLARRSAWLAALVSTVALLPSPAAAAPLLVTTTADTNDGVCDANCSLRDAVVRANTDSAEDVITLPAGAFAITGNRGEDAAATGDLDVTKPVIVRGAGPGTVIDAAGADRIFDIRMPVSFTLENATLTRGDPGPDDGARGGAIADATNGGALLIRGVAFTENRAVPSAVSGLGGAIFAVGVNTTIEDSSFTANRTGGVGPNGFGGAVATQSVASLTVRDSTFIQNVAGGEGSRGSGGALYSSAQGSINVERSLFSGNRAGGGAGGDGFGGALLIDSSGGPTTIARSTLTGNQAGPQDAGFGGAMILRANGTEVINTTISGNSASGPGFAGHGGAILNETSAPPGLRLSSSTISGNVSGTDPDDVGGVEFSGRPTTARNTIIAMNGGSDCDAPIQTSEGNNLESGSACGFTAAGDQQGKDPLLGPLADNGGPTPTQALLAASPARNAGSTTGCPAEDQRGTARPQEDVCDIGAFEFVPETAADLVAPLLTAARVTNRTWAVDPRGAREVQATARRRVKRGTTFVYSLSEDARVVFALERKAKGRKVGRRCRKPTRRNRGRKRCTRFVRAGSFAHQSVLGTNRRKFSGLIGRRKLGPGRYRASLVATDAVGNRSAPKRLGFKVVKASTRR